MLMKLIQLCLWHWFNYAYDRDSNILMRTF